MKNELIINRLSELIQMKKYYEWGYSLAMQENERLKGLIESLHTDAFGISPLKWLEYKKQNNLQ